MQCVWVGSNVCQRMKEGTGRNVQAWLENPAGPESRQKQKLYLGVAPCHISLLDLRLVTATGLQAPEYKVWEHLVFGAYRCVSPIGPMMLFST